MSKHVYQEMDGNPSGTKGSYDYLALILGRVLFFSQQIGLRTLAALDEKD